jgi:hypothetical protein
MKVKLLISITLACCALLFSNTANAQTDPIKVQFEVDGKEVHQSFRIEISLNGLVLKPKIEKGSFLFPPELLSQEKVNLRFISGKYDLSFENIPVKNFSGGLTFGVDNKPFEEENLPSEPLPNKKLALIYYISFGTVELITHVYK